MTSRITPSRSSRCWGCWGVWSVSGWCGGFSAGPGESVADTSRVVADALARDDLNRLKTLATDETRDDMIRFYDAAHPKLEKAREKWSSKDANVQVVVVEEDISKGKGETEVFYLPAAAGAPTASATPPPRPLPPAVPSPGASSRAPLAAAPPLTGPLSFHLIWIRSGKHWLLDGRTTSAWPRAQAPDSADVGGARPAARHSELLPGRAGSHPLRFSPGPLDRSVFVRRLLGGFEHPDDLACLLRRDGQGSAAAQGFGDVGVEAVPVTRGSSGRPFPLSRAGTRLDRRPGGAGPGAREAQRRGRCRRRGARLPGDRCRT